MGRKSKAQIEYEQKAEQIAYINDNWYCRQPLVKGESISDEHLKAIVDRMIWGCTIAELKNIRYWEVDVTEAKAKESICISVPCSLWTFEYKAIVDTGKRKVEVETSVSDGTRL